MEVKIFEIEKGYMPVKASEGAAGYDCFAREIRNKLNYISTNNRGYLSSGYIEIPLGFKIEIPKGYVGKLYPRSSVSNRGLFLANCVGIIDSDFRGEVLARFYPNGYFYPYQTKEAVAQLRIEKDEEIKFKSVKEKDFSETKRGDGGFGSTDKK